MGLSSDLSDASDSFIISMVVSTARGFSYIHYLFLCLFHSLIERKSDPRATVNSGLASLVVLADRLYEAPPLAGTANDDGGGGDDECVFCLDEMKHGERIRRLPCRHVFHRECVDRWLIEGVGSMSCPICRATVAVEDERRVEVERLIGAELVAWLSPY